MQTEAYIPILKRVGVVLIALGALALGQTIYDAIKGEGFSLNLNVALLIAGFLLWRGSLHAASVVRWFAFLLAGSLVAFPISYLLVVPTSLLFIEAKLDPSAFLKPVGYFFGLAALAGWLIHELRREPVLAASTADGVKVRSTLLPLGLGAGIVMTVGVALASMFSGPAAARAMELAYEKLGPDYSYFPGKVSYSLEEDSGSALVTAWNSGEIRVVPVKWGKS